MKKTKDNEIGAFGAGIIGDALKTNTTLTELSLGSSHKTNDDT